jgi:hypothetical protein
MLSPLTALRGVQAVTKASPRAGNSVIPRFFSGEMMSLYPRSEVIAIFRLPFQENQQILTVPVVLDRKQHPILLQVFQSAKTR